MCIAKSGIITKIQTKVKHIFQCSQIGDFEGYVHYQNWHNNKNTNKSQAFIQFSQIGDFQGSVHCQKWHNNKYKLKSKHIFQCSQSVRLSENEKYAAREATAKENSSFGELERSFFGNYF